MFVWLSKYRELQEEIADLKFKLLVLTNQRDTALYNLDREREAFKREVQKRQLSKQDLKKIRVLTHPDRHKGKRIAHEITLKINEMI